MGNPWEKVLLSDYEEHMKLDEVQQLQMLNGIMKKQIAAYSPRSIAILGIAGGNGLEHIAASSIERVFAIDINNEYLKECGKRYSYLGERLILRQMDITDKQKDLPTVELIIANLLIEYVGIETFVRKVEKATPGFVSCVIQKNAGDQFVSTSPYVSAFHGISELHSDIDKNELIERFSESGYELFLIEEYQLPNGKKFIRLDFMNHTFKKYIVIEARNSDYPNPLLLEKGAIVELGEISTSETWGNWIWCITENNKGWAPVQIIDRINATHGVVLEWYSATELDILKGDLFVGEKEMNGWYYGFQIESPDKKGWVPKENVAAVK